MLTPEQVARLFGAYVLLCKNAGEKPQVDFFISRCREVFGGKRAAPRLCEREQEQIATLRNAGFSYSEIGRILERPVNTVKYFDMKRRAKRCRLRTRM